ncbi:DNA primase [Bacillus phage vB_BcoS-136]|uniref:DNA primase n=1 Tax=Bacillus phage vB_BcoS-136 TaxID=2419619 RepID=A0A3G3BWB2_9CAUD|nr:DNA primase [Bacillus phage vB_BcoS-136]AYP68361.1 DNA primase [Bacillus phage vB_BcoS-136]
MSFSDLQEIKHKLLEENRIEDLLSAIGCEYIKDEGGRRITAQLPERYYSDNKRAVQVKLNESLSSSIRNKPDFKGDIFNLVSYIHFDVRGNLQDDLNNAKKFICETFGWMQFLKGEKGFVPKTDYVAPLKEIIKGKKRKKEIKPNPILPESVLDEFYYKGNPLPYKPWIDEGISYRTQVMYGVGFCLESKRVTIPLRNRFGKLVGIKGRIMKDEDDPERKYLYLYRCNNRYEWFNFHYAHPYILMDKKVYIFESEKSSMKAFDFGIYNTLAIGASEMSEEQAEMVKQLGLDIEIVLCYDKGIEIDEIKRNAELFKGRKVYAMYDTDDLLEDKSAPIDQGFETWRELEENYVFPLEI